MRLNLKFNRNAFRAQGELCSRLSVSLSVGHTRCPTIILSTLPKKKTKTKSQDIKRKKEKRRSGTGHSLSCDRQNLVITLMLLVKQCNCSARLGPSFNVSDPSRLGTGMGMGIAMRMEMGMGMGIGQMQNLLTLPRGAKLGSWAIIGIMQHQPHRCHLMCCVIHLDIEKLLDQAPLHSVVSLGQLI